jgi:hypothetical protein
LLEGPAFVDVAELIRGIADLVALRVVGQQLLEQNFRPALVIDVVVAPALVLVARHAPLNRPKRIVLKGDARDDIRLRADGFFIAGLGRRESMKPKGQEEREENDGITH